MSKIFEALPDGTRCLMENVARRNMFKAATVPPLRDAWTGLVHDTSNGCLCALSDCRLLHPRFRAL